MKKHSRKHGFTIVELLTVMSVIAILIGLLVPALNLVKKMAKDVKQQAQFHSINVALEIYSGEQEEYPESRIMPSLGSDPYTVGAQHLAEALVGRDLLGYDSMSTWNAEADETDEAIYAGDDKNSGPTLEKESLERRKGPYLNPENVEAYQIYELYSDLKGNTVYDGEITPAPVLTDAYRTKTIAKKQTKAGSPILYYKANISSKEFYNSDDGTISDPEALASIFNSIDNEDLIALGTTKDQSIPHFFEYNYKAPDATLEGRQLFYDAITNPKITSMARPYNQSSYILISAGYDGIYGTTDDIFNFNE